MKRAITRLSIGAAVLAVAVTGCGVEMGNGPDVARLVILLDGVEGREWIPDAGGTRELGGKWTTLRAGDAIGLGPLGYVVRPADVRAV